jgi:tetratricopeptide (TPR) repeat protein
MRKKINVKKIFALLLGILIHFHLLSCTLFPPPSEMIMSPAVPDPILEIIQSVLPLNAAILSLPNQTQFSFYQRYDIDGNHNDEILFATNFSQSGLEQNSVQVMIIKQFSDNWRMVWQCSSFAQGIDYLSLQDLTNDDIPEIIIGWSSGTNFEKGLNIYCFTDIPSFTTLKCFSTAYSNFEIKNLIGLQEKAGFNNKIEMIIWKKEVENAYSVDILQFSNVTTITQSTLEPVPLNEYYPTYFSSIVQYYEPLVNQYPNKTMYWYYYSFSLFYSQHYEEALEACLMGIQKNKHSTSFPLSYDYMYLHGKILLKLEEIGLAKKVFQELRSKLQERTMISVEETNLLCQAELCLANIYLQLSNVEETHQLLAQIQLYLDSVFQYQSPEKRISKIPLDAFVSRLEYQMIQTEFQANLSYLYLQKHTRRLPDGDSVLNVTTSMYPNQNCELHIHLQSFQNHSSLPFKVIDFSDIQPEFYFTNGIDNGLLHHAIIWEKDSQEKMQLLSSLLSPLWPLNEKSRIHQIFPKDITKQHYIFLYTENPMILLIQYDKNIDQWDILWHPHHQKWKANQGSISISPDLHEFVTTGTSLDNPDPRNQLFKEGMNSFYRTFIDTWRFDSSTNSYQLQQQKVENTAYSTLVDFIYSCSTNQLDQAGKLMTESLRTQKIELTPFIQNPMGQKWDISQEDSPQDTISQMLITTDQGSLYNCRLEHMETRWKIMSIRKEN